MIPDRFLAISEKENSIPEKRSFWLTLPVK